MTEAFHPTPDQEIILSKLRDEYSLLPGQVFEIREETSVDSWTSLQEASHRRIQLYARAIQLGIPSIEVTAVMLENLSNEEAAELIEQFLLNKDINPLDAQILRERFNC